MSATTAAKIIADHYDMNRLPTPEEVRQEIANLRRKKDAGTLDDRCVVLYCKLRLDQ